jgi:hypothetical protein
MTVVPSEQAGEAEAKVADLLAKARWIPAQERGPGAHAEPPAEALTGQPASL